MKMNNHNFFSSYKNNKNQLKNIVKNIINSPYIIK